MKLILMACCMLAISATYGQAKIAVQAAKDHLGEKVTVCSEVFGVKSTDKVTFINMGAAYPQAPLTLVIFAKDRANFSDTPEKLYGNRALCVTGTIKEYKGKAEIIVTTPADITVE